MTPGEIAKGLSDEKRRAWDKALRAAVEGRECPQPIYPPLTALGERIDATWETHCRHLTGRPKERATAKPDPKHFAVQLTDEQRAYVLALPVHKLGRWGSKVRLAVRALLEQESRDE